MHHIPALLLLVSAFIMSPALNAMTYDLKVSQAELQQRADNMMPLQRSKMFITTILSNPDVTLLPDTNEVGLSSDVTVKAPGNLKGQGNVALSGNIRYQADTGSFYFDNLKVRSLEIKDVPAKFIPDIKKVVESLANKLLPTHPIYTFNDKNAKQKLAKATLKSVKVEGDFLVLELGLF